MPQEGSSGSEEMVLDQLDRRRAGQRAPPSEAVVGSSPPPSLTCSAAVGSPPAAVLTEQEGRTHAVYTTVYPTAEGLQQVLDMGVEEGARSSIDQIADALG